MRIEDYGKVAATFIDTASGKAVRVAPHAEVRTRALSYCPGEPSHYKAQLHAYQLMPDCELLTVREVRLVVSVEKIISRPRVRAACDACGEEIINEREVIRDGRTLCRGCAVDAYYVPASG